MTIRLIESWEYPRKADISRRWTYMTNRGGFITPGGCQIDGTYVSYCNAQLVLLPSQVITGFWFNPLNYPPSVTNSSFLHLLKGGEANNSNQIGLGCNPDGTISVFRGPNFSGLGGTTLANGTTRVPLLSRTWIEMKVVFAAGTGGSVEVRLNGDPEILLEGIDTKPITSGGIDRFGLCSGAGTVKEFGGLYVGDGAEGFLGPCNARRLYQLPWDGETYPNFSLSGNKFDSTQVADGGGVDGPITRPSYNPAKVFAIQSTRYTASPTASTDIDWLNTPIPPEGLFAPRDALMIEALFSVSAIPTIKRGRRKFAALPGKMPV